MLSKYNIISCQFATKSIANVLKFGNDIKIYEKQRRGKQEMYPQVQIRKSKKETW